MRLVVGREDGCCRNSHGPNGGLRGSGGERRKEPGERRKDCSLFRPAPASRRAVSICSRRAPARARFRPRRRAFEGEGRSPTRSLRRRLRCPGRKGGRQQFRALSRIGRERKEVRREKETPPSRRSQSPVMRHAASHALRVARRGTFFFFLFTIPACEMGAGIGREDP